MDNPTCRKCGDTLLVGENQTAAARERNDRRCRKCRSQAFDATKHAARKRRRYATDPSARAKIAEQDRAYYAANREKKLQKVAEYYRQNREKRLEYARQYALNNPDKVRAVNARKRIKRVEREKCMGNPIAIEAYYILASIMEKHTGAKYHVDHIIPLARGGLHHEDNLQVLRADYNLRKGAKYIPALDINLNKP